MSEEAPQAAPVEEGLFPPAAQPTALETVQAWSEGEKSQAAYAGQWVGDQPTLEAEQQAVDDVKDYLESRPAEARVQGRFATAEDSAAAREDQHYVNTLNEQKSDADKTRDELLREWNNAEDIDDKTRANDVQDELQRRIENESQLNDEQKMKMIDRLYEQKSKLREESSATAESQNPPAQEVSVNIQQDSEKAGEASVEAQESQVEELINPDGPEQTGGKHRGEPAEEEPTPIYDELKGDSGDEGNSTETKSGLDPATEAELDRQLHKHDLLPDEAAEAGDTTGEGSNEGAEEGGEAGEEGSEEGDDYHEQEHTPEEDDARGLQVVGEAAPEILDTEHALEAYNHAIDQYAQAKIRAERILAGKEAKEALEAAGATLAEAHNNVLRAQVAEMNAADQMQEAAYEHNQQAIDQANDERDGLVAQRAAAREAGNYDGSLDGRIDALAAEVREMIANQTTLEEDMATREQQREAVITQQAIALRDAVEQSMQRQREAAHPRWAKFTKFMTDHPSVRTAISAGLVGIGVLGTATGLVPLTALSIAGGAVMRGVGAYGISRGIGDMISKRQLRGDNLRTVEDYLAASSKDSNTQKWSKRAGAILAVAAAAGPAINQIHQLMNHPNAQPPTKTGGPHNKLDIKPGAHTFPWTNGMEHLHTNISDPSQMRIWTHYPGIHFTGNGLGGGHGAITSVTYNGHTFHDFAHINGALNYIYNHPR